MHQHSTLIKTLLTIPLFVGLVILFNVSRSSATTSLLPQSLTNAIEAHLVLRPQSNTFNQSDLNQAGKVIEKRLQLAGLNGSFEVLVEADYITMQLSEGRSLPYIKTLITNIGQIEFIDGGLDINTLPHDSSVESRILFTNNHVQSFVPPTNGDMFYNLVLTPMAVKQMDTFLIENSNHHICIAIDSEVANCSSMYHWSANNLSIIPNLGGTNNMAMNELMIFVKSGALPFSLELAN